MAAVYCQAVLCYDQRIALDGAPAETVDAEAKDLVAKQLAKLAARKAAKKVAKPAASAAVKPKPASAPTERAIARPSASRSTSAKSRSYFQWQMADVISACAAAGGHPGGARPGGLAEGRRGGQNRGLDCRWCRVHAPCL
jgi:sRNA-binding protein